VRFIRDWHLSQRGLRGGHGFFPVLQHRLDRRRSKRTFSFKNLWSANSAEIARERELHRLAATDVGRRRIEKRRRHPEASLPLLNVQT